VSGGVKVMRYREPEARRGVGIRGQPRPHYYFHRPLCVLLNMCFEVGFVLDGIEEPSFEPDELDPRGFSWKRLPEIPPVLAARLRLSAG
jgi:hypothetical protein